MYFEGNMAWQSEFEEREAGMEESIREKEEEEEQHQEVEKKHK